MIIAIQQPATLFQAFTELLLCNQGRTASAFDTPLRLQGNSILQSACTDYFLYTEGAVTIEKKSQKLYI
ncbi:hypothetical protein [Alkalicoccus luteus]|uniref:hypothetical protein n=1 Tax=Alkalicoccus luteus TaxID=1237094 RepID=UPI00143A8AFF|nr:hypothetical protein [Alkalicoccus luteus]